MIEKYYEGSKLKYYEVKNDLKPPRFNSCTGSRWK